MIAKYRTRLIALPKLKYKSKLSMQVKNQHEEGRCAYEKESGAVIMRCNAFCHHGALRFGVKKIEAVGKAFDPELHDAISHVEDETLGEQVVKEEFRTGYIIGDKVIRHSMVIVAN